MGAWPAAAGYLKAQGFGCHLAARATAWVLLLGSFGRLVMRLNLQEQIWPITVAFFLGDGSGGISRSSNGWCFVRYCSRSSRLVAANNKTCNTDDDCDDSGHSDLESV